MSEVVQFRRIIHKIKLPNLHLYETSILPYDSCHALIFQVVVKFIQKSKIVPSSWTEDKSLGTVPLEVFYLAKIDHPNVVKVCFILNVQKLCDCSLQLTAIFGLALVAL